MYNMYDRDSNIDQFLMSIPLAFFPFTDAVVDGIDFGLVTSGIYMFNCRYYLNFNPTIPFTKFVYCTRAKHIILCL